MKSAHLNTTIVSVQVAQVLGCIVPLLNLNTTIVSVQGSVDALKKNDTTNLNTTIVSVQVIYLKKRTPMLSLFKYNHCVGSRCAGCGR